MKKELELLKEFNFIAPTDLEDILEYLEDNSCLSASGKKLRKDFWSLFIKNDK